MANFIGVHTQKGDSFYIKYILLTVNLKHLASICFLEYTLTHPSFWGRGLKMVSIISFKGTFIHGVHVGKWQVLGNTSPCSSSSSSCLLLIHGLKALPILTWPFPLCWACCQGQSPRTSASCTPALVLETFSTMTQQFTIGWWPCCNTIKAPSPLPLILPQDFLCVCCELLWSILSRAHASHSSWPTSPGILHHLHQVPAISGGWPSVTNAPHLAPVATDLKLLCLSRYS